jgi:CRP/FNR family transcriptional regulator, nitrogen oxide reductase regulator
MKAWLVIGGEMKTESGARRVVTPSEIAARVSELAPRFVEGFAPSDLAVILGAATLRRFQAHSLIANEGHAADKLFLMIEGRARTFTTTRKGEKVVLLWIATGETSGGRALLSEPMEYLVSTETVTDSLVLVWNRSAILPLTKQYPRLLENALRIASDYVEAYRELHLAATYHTASQRVARVLDSLAKGIGRRTVEGIELNVSNEELANEANVTIFTVSRLLSEWQRKGLLVKSRGRIVIRLPEEPVESAGRMSPIAVPGISATKIAREQRWNEIQRASS